MTMICPCVVVKQRCSSPVRITEGTRILECDFQLVSSSQPRLQPTSNWDIVGISFTCGHLISMVMKQWAVPFCHHGSWQAHFARTPQAVSIGDAVQMCGDVIGQMAPVGGSGLQRAPHNQVGSLGWIKTCRIIVGKMKRWTSICLGKTRCSPRTRMLTRMLMVQMSKHMETQSCKRHDNLLGNLRKGEVLQLSP